MQLNPKYIWMYQKPYCCNITCLLMILYRNWYPLYEQDYLAKYFDIKIEEKCQWAFWVELNYFTQKWYDEWLKTIESENLINQFFLDHNISLSAKSYKISQIENLDSFIQSNIKKNNDLWVEYKIHEIFNINWVHDWLIESIDTSEIIMLDTDSGSPSRFSISSEKLQKSLGTDFWRETWIVIISKI